jgi:hypothetical protein
MPGEAVHQGITCLLSRDMRPIGCFADARAIKKMVLRPAASKKVKACQGKIVSVILTLYEK